MAEKKMVISAPDREKDNSTDRELSGRQDRKRKLLDDIAKLKACISRLEAKIETPKFGQLRLPKIQSELSSRTVTSCDISDILSVQAKLCYDLYEFIGIRCVRFEDRFVFEISSGEDIMKNSRYAIEIFVDDDGCGKLGKWVLPMSIDIQKILSQHPISNLNNVKYFLKICKHYVDCYIYRAKQLEALKSLLSNIKNIRMTHNNEITTIELTIIGIKDISDNRIIMDTDDKEKPSASLKKSLKRYAKPFLKKDLISAFQEISESQNEFVWKKILTDDDENDIEICESSDENTGLLSEFLHQGDKRLRRNKIKTQNESNNSLHDDETSLCVDKEKCEDIDVAENKRRNDFKKETKEMKSIRYNQNPAKIAMQLRKTKKDYSEKTKKGISKTAKRDMRDQNIADVNPQSKVNTINHDKRRRKSHEKHQENVECKQVEDKSVLLENSYCYNNNSNNNNIDNKINKRNVSPSANNEHKGGQKRKLYNEPNDKKHLVNSQRKKKRRKIMWTDTITDEERHKMVTSNDNEKMNISCSTPLPKKLPNKQKFFHTSHISEILSIK